MENRTNNRYNKRYNNRYNKRYVKSNRYDNKPKSKPKQEITRGYSLNYLNPFNHEYPPADPDSYGKFVTLNSVSRFEFQTSTTKDRIFVFCPSIQGLYQLIMVQEDGTVLPNLWKSPSYSYKSEPPTSSRTLRAGVKLRNLTSNNDTGGIVHVLNSSSPLETSNQWSPAAPNATGATTSTFAGELVMAASSAVGSKSYTAASLQTGDNLFVIPPASSSAYHTYDAWDNENTANALTRSFDAKAKNISMNNLIIVFGKTSVVNTYEFTLGIQIAARYPMNTLISNFQKDAIKSKDADFMKKVEEHVQSHGSDTADEHIDGLMAMLGKKKKT